MINNEKKFKKVQEVLKDFYKFREVPIDNFVADIMEIFENENKFPEFVYIGIDEYWIKCKQVFDSNYEPIKEQEGRTDIPVPLQLVKSTVCGKRIKYFKHCIPRDI